MEGQWRLLVGAARSGDVEEVLRLIQEDPEIVNMAAGMVRWTALHGHLEVVQHLVDYGADIDIKNNDDATPLHRACTGGHLEVVDLLVSSGADPTVQTEFQWTPLMCASSWCRVDVVRYLLGIKAVRTTIEAQSEHGHTALHHALWITDITPADRLEVLKLLVEAGANPTVTNNEGHTPMDKAKAKGYQDCIPILQVRNVLWPHLHLGAIIASLTNCC